MCSWIANRIWQNTNYWMTSWTFYIRLCQSLWVFLTVQIIWGRTASQYHSETSAFFWGFLWWLSYGSDNSKVLCPSISQKRRGWVTGLPLHSKSSSSATCPVSWLPRQKIQRTERGVATALRGAVPRWREVGAGAIVGATHWVDKRPREGCRTPSLKKAYPALPWRLSYSL